MNLKTLHLTAVVSLIALILLSIAWEMWLAPIQPGGSWLILKALPLLLLCNGILRRRRYAHQVASLVSLLYLMEGVLRALSDRGISQGLARVETLLALTLFVSVVFYARKTGRDQVTGNR
ncbi:membrane protein [Betaproteobacteria bacterium]|nr:membrane protein [Betaproteobacteria bacterium]